MMQDLLRRYAYPNLGNPDATDACPYCFSRTSQLYTRKKAEKKNGRVDDYLDFRVLHVSLKDLINPKGRPRTNEQEASSSSRTPENHLDITMRNHHEDQASLEEQGASSSSRTPRTRQEDHTSLGNHEASRPHKRRRTSIGKTLRYREEDHSYLEKQGGSSSLEGQREASTRIMHDYNSYNEPLPHDVSATELQIVDGQRPNGQDSNVAKEAKMTKSDYQEMVQFFLLSKTSNDQDMNVSSVACSHSAHQNGSEPVEVGAIDIEDNIPLSPQHTSDGDGLWFGDPVPENEPAFSEATFNNPPTGTSNEDNKNENGDEPVEVSIESSFIFNATSYSIVFVQSLTERSLKT